MKITQNFGPLLNCGDIDGGTYELRGDALETSMLYAYVKVEGNWREKTTQLGGSAPEILARDLIRELKAGR